MQRRDHTIVRALLTSILLVTIGTLLSGCVVPTVTPPGSEVEATVEAAIALAVKATLTATSPDTETVDNDQVAAVATDTPDEAANSEREEPLMLITPTPDRSAEITQMIVANTRHFKGDPNAPVTLIEFSDFL